MNNRCSINSIPVEVFQSSILLYLISKGDFDLRTFLNLASVNKRWYNMIYNIDFINILLHKLDITHLSYLFTLSKNATIPLEIDRFRYVKRELYYHKLSLTTDVIPIENENFDLLESNAFRVKGNIEQIILKANPLIGENDIDLKKKFNIDTNELNLSISVPINESYIWGLDIDSNKQPFIMTQFKVRTPPNFTIIIIGNVKIKELILRTHILSPELPNIENYELPNNIDPFLPADLIYY